MLMFQAQRPPELVSGGSAPGREGGPATNPQRALAHSWGRSGQPRPARQQARASTGSQAGPAAAAAAAAVADGAQKALEVQAARQLAGARHRHSQSSAPLFVDPFAEALSLDDTGAPVPLPPGGVSLGAGPASAAAAAAVAAAGALSEEEVATAWLDQSLQSAVSHVNMDLRQEYRQVVLLGAGMDTRPFRLLWPPGLFFLELAPAEVHAVAAAKLSAAGAAPAAGCLLRRVALEHGPSASPHGPQLPEASIQRAGFQAGRLSVWVLQGTRALLPAPHEAAQLLASVSLQAAFGSFIMGELAAPSRAAVEGLLAGAGFLGRVVSCAEAAAELAPAPQGEGSPSEEERGTGSRASGEGEGSREARGEAGGFQTRTAAAPGAAGEDPRWLFVVQQRQRALAEMNTYGAHVAAAEETDEDFFDNIS